MIKEWEEERDNLLKTNETMTAKVDQQNRQNKLLHEQLQTLNEQVRDSRRRASVTGSFETSHNESLGEDQTSLLELTAIMRKDQEIAETSRDATYAENIRLKQQIKNTQKKLDEKDALLRFSWNLYTAYKIYIQWSRKFEESAANLVRTARKSNEASERHEYSPGI